MSWMFGLHGVGLDRAEIPHLLKLEKEMRGKDVVFIGVSVDEQKDYKKWLEALEQEGLEGIQLFANGKNKQGRDKIMNDYKIKGIPRFMVFNKKGKVVTINSAPSLKSGTEELVAKVVEIKRTPRTRK